MRLRFCFAALFLCIALAGCAQVQEEAPPLAGHTGNYTTSANISYKDLSATATISQGSPQSCSVSFSSPASLADLSFVFWQDTVDISYKSLSYSVSPDSVPGNAVAQMAVSAINAAMKDQGVTVTYEDDILLLNGMMESGAFTLKLDRENGNLIKLSVPSEDLEIEFVDFQFLD